MRNKGGEFVMRDSSALLDFLRGELGLRRHEGGIKGVKDGLDVELVALVPFCRNAEAESGGAAWTFSTFDLDRFSERIDPAGWDYSHYLKNPVVEWAHRYDIPAIGKADNLFTDEDGLHGLVVFNDKDYDPFGWAIGERVRRGVIRAGSVGFRVLEIEIPSKEDGKDGTTLIFRKQELLEFSICNVPANPFALTKEFAADRAAGFPDFLGNIITNHTGGNNG
ncbi:MAG: HK97 family phage prohead protease [Spirochaetaceae bacterium]|nr:HK97 family phage prohead protease [Spirochaetaceae bacterium]